MIAAPAAAFEPLAFYRALHASPELSFQEKETAAMTAMALDLLAPPPA